MSRRAWPAWLTILLVLVLGCRAETPPSTEMPPTAEAPPAVETPPAAETPPATASAAEIDIPNARTPIDGILTGGQPSVEQFEAAAQAGYRTIVNLRAPGEKGSWDEAAKAEELGLRYVAIPIAGVDGLTTENARKLAEIVDDPQNLPAMVHCASGNRVGGLFAMKALHVDGQDAEQALASGREAGLTKLEAAVTELLSPAE